MDVSYFISKGEGVHESNSLEYGCRMRVAWVSIFNVIQFEFSNFKTTKPLIIDKTSCIFCHAVVKHVGLCQDYCCL